VDAGSVAFVGLSQVCTLNRWLAVEEVDETRLELALYRAILLSDKSD
jgi:hypothetical protein